MILLLRTVIRHLFFNQELSSKELSSIFFIIIIFKNNNNLFINIFQASYYLQVKSGKKYY